MIKRGGARVLSTYNSLATTTNLLNNKNVNNSKKSISLINYINYNTWGTTTSFLIKFFFFIKQYYKIFKLSVFYTNI